MRRKRLILGAATAGLTAIVFLLGGVFHDSSSATRRRPHAPPTAATSASSRPASRAGGTRQAIVARLQATLRATPTDVRSLDLLGLAYQQRARETGDPTYYTKSEQALRRALRLAPQRPHRDERPRLARALAPPLSQTRSCSAAGRTRISPTTALNYGVIGDALVELGRYPAAFSAFDTMATLRPGLSSYARVSHALDLLGRVPEAIDAMKLAVQASAGEGEPEAWTRFQLGKLYWSIGRRRPRPSARTARRCASSPATTTRSTRSSRIEAAQGPQPRRDRARAAGRRPDPAAAVRRPARRPLPRRPASRRRRASSTR